MNSSNGPFLSTKFPKEKKKTETNRFRWIQTRSLHSFVVQVFPEKYQMIMKNLLNRTSFFNYTKMFRCVPLSFGDKIREEEEIERKEKKTLDSSPGAVDSYRKFLFYQWFSATWKNSLISLNYSVSNRRSRYETNSKTIHISPATLTEMLVINVSSINGSLKRIFPLTSEFNTKFPFQSSD